MHPVVLAVLVVLVPRALSTNFGDLPSDLLGDICARFTDTVTMAHLSLVSRSFHDTLRMRLGVRKRIYDGVVSALDQDPTFALDLTEALGVYERIAHIATAPALEEAAAKLHPLLWRGLVASGGILRRLFLDPNRHSDLPITLSETTIPDVIVGIIRDFTQSCDFPLPDDLIVLIEALYPQPFCRIYFPCNILYARQIVKELMKRGQQQVLADPQLVTDLLLLGVRFEATHFLTTVRIKNESDLIRIYRLLRGCSWESDEIIINEAIRSRDVALFAAFLRIPGVKMRFNVNVYSMCRNLSISNTDSELLMALGRDEFLQVIIREPYFHDLTIRLLETALDRHQEKIARLLLSALPNSTVRALGPALSIYIRKWDPSMSDFRSVFDSPPFLSRVDPDAVFAPDGILQICISNNRCDIAHRVLQSESVLNRLKSPKLFKKILEECVHKIEFFEFFCENFHENVRQLSAEFVDVLAAAIHYRRYDSLKIALHSFPTVVNLGHPKDGSTLLHLAFRNYDERIVDLLLSLPGIAVFPKNALGFDPLSDFIEFFWHQKRFATNFLSFLETDAFRSQFDAALIVAALEPVFNPSDFTLQQRKKAFRTLRQRLLADESLIGRIVNARSSPDGDTLLRYAVQQKDVESIHEFLSQPGLDFRIQNAQTKPLRDLVIQKFGSRASFLLQLWRAKPLHLANAVRALKMT